MHQAVSYSPGLEATLFGLPPARLSVPECVPERAILSRSGRCSPTLAAGSVDAFGRIGHVQRRASPRPVFSHRGLQKVRWRR